MSTERKKSRRENPLVSLAVNIVIPVIILVRFSGEDQLGPVNGLLVALAFPVGYGLYDFIVRRGFNPYSMLGFASVLLTGGIGLLKLPVEWLAIKEAAIPFIICVAVVVSMRTPYPLVKTIMHKVINVERVYEALERRQSVEAYERRVVTATYMIAFGLLVSTILNYVLARVVVVSEPGTTAFNEELGRMTALSFPVITVPSITILGNCAILPRQRDHERDGTGVPGHLQDDRGRRMNLIIAGCEYSGTTTLANGIAEWARRTMGGTQEIHDHFKIPHIATYRIGPPAEPSDRRGIATDHGVDAEDEGDGPAAEHELPHAQHVPGGRLHRRRLPHRGRGVCGSVLRLRAREGAAGWACGRSMPDTSRRSSFRRRRTPCSSASRPRRT